MKHIKKVKIDIDKKNFEVIPSVQYDNTRFLHIHLLNGSVPFNLTGCSVKISGTKPDGTAIFNNCTVINAKEGFIEVELTEQMNAAPGTVKCELKLYSGSGVLTTKHFDIDVTASVTSKNITSGNEFKALEEALSKVNNIDTKFESLTEATVKAATEKEIQKQIDGGRLANMTIADNTIEGKKIKDGAVDTRALAQKSVTLEKLGDDIELEPAVNSVSIEKLNLQSLDMKFDCYRPNKTSGEMYGIYLYENHQIQDSATSVKVEFVVYTETEFTAKIGCKMFNNNNSDIQNLAGGQTIQGPTPISMKKGFNKFTAIINNVSLNYRYYRVMPWIQWTDKNSDKLFYIANVKTSFPNSEKIGSAMYKSNDSTQFIKATTLPTQIMLTKDVKGVLIENNEVIVEAVINNARREYINIQPIALDEVATAGKITHVFITLSSENLRMALEKYEMKIPKGTVFSYDLYNKLSQNTITQHGLQLFHTTGFNNGTFNAGLGYASCGKVSCKEGINHYKHETTSDTTFTIKTDNVYFTLCLDVIYGSTPTSSGQLHYSNISCILPDGTDLFKPIGVYYTLTRETYDVKHDLDRVALRKHIKDEISKVQSNVKDTCDVLRAEITNSKRVPSRWTGKRYISVGDSITWQHGQTNYLPNKEPLKGYQYYILQRLGIDNFTNAGVSGMTMAKYEGWSTTFINNYQKIAWANFDLVTIALGTNDKNNGGGCRVGDIDSYDVSTYCGAYNTVIKYILQTNPKIRIVLMTPFQCQSRNGVSPHGHKLIDFVNAVIKLGEKWSCPVFDCYRLAGWNECTFSTYTVDGLHGSAAGFENVGIPLGEFLALQ